MVHPPSTMTLRTRERRRSLRLPAAYPVRLLDRRGRIKRRARTVNVSETGVMILISDHPTLEMGAELRIEIDVPDPGKTRGSRTVRYRARVVRRQELGQMLGLGLEFAEKLA